MSKGTAASPLIRIVNPLEDPQWEERVETFSNASTFHTAAWAKVLSATYGFRPIYIAEEVDGKLTAVLPLMEVDSWLKGRRGIGLPFTDECAVLGDVTSAPRLCGEAIQMGKDRGWRYLELRSSATTFPHAPSSTSFFSHSLTLGSDVAALFAGIKQSNRGAIKKAEKSGLTIEFAQSLAAVDAFYGLLCKTRKRHGVPPQPIQFFRNIQQHVLARNFGWIVLAKWNGTPVAAGVFFHFGRIAIHKFGASDEAFQHLSANNLILWEAIKWYASHEFHMLDFGRTSTTNAGLRKFKLSWGSRETSINYVRYDLRNERFIEVGDEANGWHNHVFRMLPLPLSRLAGALLYKHMA